MKYLFVLLIMTLHFISYGQSLLGQWETYDDETNEKKAVLEIYKSDNLYFAKIIDSYVSDENALCETCRGEQKGKPIIGLLIIENIRQDGDNYIDGTILDPENGETYKCYLELEDKNTLKVRGFLGFSLFGRTQYWTRKNSG